MNYDDYFNQCEHIRNANDELLQLFEEDLVKNNLTNKTINRHLSNVDFYINDYLLHEDAYSMEVGTRKLDDYLGNFFIRKCMWSTPGTIKTTASSIKKFYKCMLEHKKIEKKDYDFLCSEIKNNMDIWQSQCAIYNNPDEPNPFFLF